jgi:hypothetical protein
LGGRVGPSLLDVIGKEKKEREKTHTQTQVTLVGWGVGGLRGAAPIVAIVCRWRRWKWWWGMAGDDIPSSYIREEPAGWMVSLHSARGLVGG